MKIININAYNKNFHSKKYFYQFIMIINQEIFDNQAKIDKYFFANYTKNIL